MTPEKYETGLESEEIGTGTITVDLDALREFGPEALRSNGISDIIHITLRGVVTVGDGESGEVVNRKARDIFRTHGTKTALAEIAPKGTHLVQATLDFTFLGELEPHEVQIAWPNVIRCEYPEDGPIVYAWLARSLLRMAQEIGRAAAMVLVVLTVSVSCGMDADDGGDDEDDTAGQERTTESITNPGQ